MKIDSHQHFWKFDPVRDSWIDEQMQQIRRDFFPGDLLPILQQEGFDGSIVVQSDQSEAENVFQLDHAQHYDFIKGIVGWVDLQSPAIAERLQEYSRFRKMKGFRHVLQGEPDRALMLKPAFKNGIGLLKKYGFTYDLLIFPDQLPYCTELVKAFPDQPFVLNHIAKPGIKRKEIMGWKEDISALAKQENVYCKVSGMITEADWHEWTAEEMAPYLDVVFEAFGANRVMFGSDWPVCEVAGGYGKVTALMKNYMATFSATEQRKFWGENAAGFYGIA